MDDTDRTSTASTHEQVLSDLAELYDGLSTGNPRDYITVYGGKVQRMSEDLVWAAYTMGQGTSKEYSNYQSVSLLRPSEGVDASTKATEIAETSAIPDYNALKVRLLAYIGIGALRTGVSSNDLPERERSMMNKMGKIEGLNDKQKWEIVHALIGVLDHPSVPIETLQILARYVIAKDKQDTASMEAIEEEVKPPRVQAMSVDHQVQG